MANVGNRFDNKYCIQFYNNKFCINGDRCTYPHRHRAEVEQVCYDAGNAYFIGRVRPHQKICVYYRKGHCMYGKKCNFIHDNGGVEIEPTIPADSVTDSSNDHPSSPCSSGSVEAANKNNIYNTMETQESEIIMPKENTACAEEDTAENDNLQPDEEEGACASPPLTSMNQSWADAPEFVPKGTSVKPKSYAEALNAGNSAEKNASRKLCPYVNKDGICRNMTDCTYLHGEMCDMCCRLILHPYNEEQRKRHRQECIKQHEKNMELSFAIARSKEKSCGVCFEVIMEKASGEQRFGILPNCNHCFCLTCIRKWRQARQFENKIIRACPECRVTSDFVCPSMYWVDTKEDKEKLILDYKNALARKDCKYFKKGAGKCPFGNKCFYLHAFPDGSKCDVGPPPRQRRRRNVDNELDVLQQVMLWDFLDDRDFPWQSLADDLEDLVSFFTDSDESDWSDYELFFD